MPGFDSNDVLFDDISGYRADALRNGIVSYNGFQFPPAISTRVTVVPEYSDNKVSIKYNTIAIQIEFIATDPAKEVQNLTLRNDDSGIGSEFDENQVSMNAFMESLITRLSNPGGVLIFNGQGFKDYVVNTGSTYALDGGPKPQVIEWEPLGGSNAARVQWLCIFRVPPCSNGTSKLTSLSYSVDWDINSAGFMTRTISGAAEFAVRMSTNVEGVAVSSGGRRLTNFDLYEDLYKDYILPLFPMLKRFKRNYRFGRSDSIARHTFTITDIEIESDSIFPPGVSDIELVQNISSSLERGFTIWSVTYTGRLEVVNAKKGGGSIEQAKKIAWAWLGKILKEKKQLFKRTIETSTSQLIKKSQEASTLWRGTKIGVGTIAGIAVGSMVGQPLLGGVIGAAAGNHESANSIPRYGVVLIPNSVSFTDYIYGNQIIFTISYTARCTTDLVTASLGAFEPINSSEYDLGDDEWVTYIQTVGAHEGRVPVKEQFILEVNSCSTNPARTSPGEIAAKKARKNREEESLTQIETPEEGKDFEYYENQIELIDDSGNVIGVPLSKDALITTESIPPNFSVNDGRIDEEMSTLPFDPGRPEVSPGLMNQEYNKIKVYKPRNSLCYVRVRGKASRINGRVSPPVLMGMGEGISRDSDTGEIVVAPGAEGAIAHRIDSNATVYNVERMGIGVDGKTIVRYKCSWDRMYVLDRIPIKPALVTSGNPLRFA